ncbi:integrase/recombinase domain protein [Mycobacteroides abscessus subsp. bolletii 1513]|uniref:Integrase/recombinase domain protein n=1 Tax=Mycobacteroides abscessus subsp. bolletii 1513 TaxID=1299321 RepID=X8DUK4_9MYCO|nr:integrase/recombinase domain protein [Mycobacteroides abscessus subsp. bolletii 1513]
MIGAFEADVAAYPVGGIVVAGLGKQSVPAAPAPQHSGE